MSPHTARTNFELHDDNDDRSSPKGEAFNGALYVLPQASVVASQAQGPTAGSKAMQGGEGGKCAGGGLPHRAPCLRCGRT
jgi:hypothetical protein